MNFNEELSLQAQREFATFTTFPWIFIYSRISSYVGHKWKPRDADYNERIALSLSDKNMCGSLTAGFRLRQ